jgi:beta-phosphoglucomutase family hydrolase
MFGCIFDCDGVVIDSSAPHIAAWKLLAKDEGLVFPEHLFKQSFGMKNEQIIPQLFKWTDNTEEIRRLDRKKELYYRNYILEHGASTFLGVKTFLEKLSAGGIPCVIGSSAPRANVDTSLSVLGFKKYFKDIVSGEDVHIGKPDPGIFLAAAEKLELKPCQCVVFEDAHVGIEAAKAGGMKVIAVANTFPEEALLKADRVVGRIDETDIDFLAKMFETADKE